MTPAAVSAKELASLRLPGLPATERSINRRAEKEAWRFVWHKNGGPACRKYIVPFLPEAVRIALARAAALPQAVPTSVHHSDGALAGALRGVVLAQESAEARTRDAIERERALARFLALPPEKKREAEARLEILQARDAFVNAVGLPIKRGTLLYCKEFAAGNITLPDWIMQSASRKKLKLSWATLNRWQQAYAEQGLPGLANGYKAVNKGATTVAPSQQSLLEAMLIKHPETNVTDLLDALAVRFDGQYIPSGSSVSRWVTGWKKQHASLYMYITSPDEWKNKHSSAGGMADENIERLNQLWEFDSTPADVMLTDGRHSVIGVIDIFSRRGKLQVTPTSKATAVAALARRAILDWGVPEGAKTDNGQDYVSNHLVRVFEDLAITQHLCTPFESQEKPFIERFFRTVMHGTVKLLPGYIGHNVVARKKIEARKSFAKRIMTPGEVIEVSLSADEFQTILNDWVEAYYHQRKHNALGGRSPSEAARAWTMPIRRITDQRALDLLLCEAPGNNGIRTVGKKGIQIDNTFYDSPHLAGFEGRQVRCLLGADYGTIIVYNADGAEAGQYLCTAIDPARTGHDRAEMAARKKAIQKKIYQEGSKELKKEARAQAVEHIYREILDHKKAQIANVLPLPQKSIEYSSPALQEAGFAAEDIRRQNAGPVPAPISIDELAKSEAILSRLEKKSGIRQAQPGNDMEAYLLLRDELEKGLELSDTEHRWLAEYDLYSASGKRTGLVKSGWQPYAERSRIAREMEK